MKVTAHLQLLCLLVAIVIVLTAGRAGNLLDPLFLLASLAIGFRALRKSPTRDYVSFTLLLWMFSPFVRRLVDWQSGRHEFSLSLISPLAVTLLAVFALPRVIPRTTFKTAIPFFLYLAIVVYGLLLGLANGRGFAAIYAAANWIAPIVFALLIISNPAANAQTRETLTRTMIGGGVVMSIYGAFQFIVAPPWDAAWMIGAHMASIGRPEPFAIRVFSTMNAPGIFAVAVSSAFLLIFNKLSSRTIVAGATLLLGLALSLVRSSWGAVGLGIVFLVLLGDVRTKFRAVVIIGLVGLASMPLLMRAEFFDTISSRFDSLTSLQDDQSLKDRRELARNFLDNYGQFLIGKGIGATGVASNLGQIDDSVTSFDNGLLNPIFTFGFMGFIIIAILFSWAVSLIKIILSGGQATVFAVISIVQIVMLTFADILSGANAVFFFSFLSVALGEKISRSLHNQKHRISLSPSVKKRQKQAEDLL